MYQWRKRGSNSLPDKVSGVNSTVLTIPNLGGEDEGQYYCIVTNEWDRYARSKDIILIVKGNKITNQLLQVCVRVCVRARMYACVYMCMCVHV